MRYDYQVYARACSRCHTLARYINAPYAGRAWWEFYVLGMRARSRIAGRPFSKDEVQAVAASHPASACLWWRRLPSLTPSLRTTGAAGAAAVISRACTTV